MAISKDKKKALDGLLGKINKRFGTNSINYLVDVQEELRIKFFKTPSHEVNSVLGGGFGKGKIIELYGQNSCGKTSLALEVIKKAQDEDPEFMAAWLETERSFDSDYVEKFGIDMDRLIVSEQSEDLTAEDCMEVIRSLTNSGLFGIVVLNSVAALSPKKEVLDNFEDQQVALTARLLSKFLRVTTGALGKSNTSLILINQLRANIGGNSKYFPTTTTGGMAIPFYATQRIEMKRETIKAGDPIGEEEGVKIRCRVIKNRLAKGNPYKMCNYYALYGKGIDGDSELGAVLMREEIVTKGSWIYYPSKEEMAKVPSVDGPIDAKWNGATKFTDYLKENPEGREFFIKLLDEKLSNGTAGESLSEEEAKELERLNQSVEDVGSELDEAVVTE